MNQAVQWTDFGRSSVQVDVCHTRNPLSNICRKHDEEGVLCEGRLGRGGWRKWEEYNSPPQLKPSSSVAQMLPGNEY